MTATQRIDGADITKTFLAILEHVKTNVEAEVRDASFTLNHGTGVAYRIWADRDCIEINQWTEGFFRQHRCTEISITMRATHDEAKAIQTLLRLVVSEKEAVPAHSALSALIDPRDKVPTP